MKTTLETKINVDHACQSCVNNFFVCEGLNEYMCVCASNSFILILILFYFCLPGKWLPQAVIAMIN